MVKVNVPIRWFCKNLKREIKLGRFAEVCSVDRGWVCDCGEWVITNDISHKILKFDIMEGE